MIPCYLSWNFEVKVRLLKGTWGGVDDTFFSLFSSPSSLVPRWPLHHNHYSTTSPSSEGRENKPFPQTRGQESFRLLNCRGSLTDYILPSLRETDGRVDDFNSEETTPVLSLYTTVSWSFLTWHKDLGSPFILRTHNSIIEHTAKTYISENSHRCSLNLFQVPCHRNSSTFVIWGVQVETWRTSSSIYGIFSYLRSHTHSWHTGVPPVRHSFPHLWSVTVLSP